ncbi:MAG: glycosyltransferase family 2 protein [Kiritimatiellae bacterium]|nr:glycosyltransferase family 2 protein [Kiritimatiellia bacterium]
MSEDDRPPISACVICFNEERKIRRCLESVRWCAETVVLDSFSTDRTVEIAREYTNRVHQHEWLGYVGQRNLVRSLATQPWLLFLDSDEEVSPGLRDEVIEEFRRGPAPHVGYEFPRMVQYLGRWIRHGEWYPDIKLRLFHRDYGRSEGIEPHDRVVVTGPVKRLRNPLYHYTYDDIEDHVATLNRFSTITAQQKFVAGDRFHWHDLLLRPPLRFIKGYILRAGFLDGTHGLLIALLAAMGAALKYAKLWELHRQARLQGRAAPPAPS